MAIIFGGNPNEETSEKAAKDTASSTESKGFIVGALDKAFDLLEKTTKTDLDGDGVIGANPSARESKHGE